MKKSVMVIVAFSAAVAAQAGLVARWDFNNYDPANPKSTGVLAATVGEDAYPCYYKGRGSALVTDGTIGQMYVCEANATDANATTNRLTSPRRPWKCTVTSSSIKMFPRCVSATISSV